MSAIPREESVYTTPLDPVIPLYANYLKLKYPHICKQAVKSCRGPAKWLGTEADKRLTAVATQPSTCYMTGRMRVSASPGRGLNNERPGVLVNSDALNGIERRE
jgi:hypothetical protein